MRDVFLVEVDPRPRHPDEVGEVEQLVHAPPRQDLAQRVRAGDERQIDILAPLGLKLDQARAIMETITLAECPSFSTMEPLAVARAPGFADVVIDGGPAPRRSYVSTPGGLVYGTQEFGDIVFEVRAQKPVIAVASNWMVASAGYWIATQASAFFASPSSDVGSLGVYAGHTDMSGFEDKLGMKTTLIASDPEKIQGHGYAPLAEEARAEIQASVDESNRAFVAAVARGRGMAAADVPAVHGKGRLVSAPRATAAGAIDGVMTLREVIAKYQSSRSRLALMRRRAELLGVITEI